ncbi:MAG: hypothetical protein ACREBQ_11920, partial [Nitrososphaerales archaeon]
MRELEYFLNSLSKCLTVTLSTQSAYLKTSVLFSIVNYLSSQDKRVDFLDLDLQFSSMLANLKTESALTSFEKMMTYCPKESEVFDSIISLLSQKDLGRGGAIIMDSINSLQDLLRQADNDPDSAKANHRAAIILTIFQELARNNSKLLILSNIVRSRPHMR